MRNSPSISGPSFLGLNEPPAAPSRARLTVDPHAEPTSRNLDYLLDDEEEPRRGGAGKIVLILLALALAVGLGYLRWKKQGFAWLNPAASKPTVQSQNPDSAPANSPAPEPSDSTQNPPAGSSTPSSQPAASPAPGADNTASNPPAAAATPPASTPSTTSPGPDNTAAAPKSDANAPAAVPASAPKSSTTAPTNDSSTTDQPKPAAEIAPKPPAVSKPVKPADPVVEAQKFLYGRGGVRQDCDRGLRILKPAANEANPKAMVEMGALYSAGLCTPRDLPTAYRWFALALRKDPDNQEVQNDLQKLWGEMTQPERQLAIKLSQ